MEASLLLFEYCPYLLLLLCMRHINNDNDNDDDDEALINYRNLLETIQNSTQAGVLFN